jgi:capsular exopolysaccharide synthesis family protein
VIDNRLIQTLKGELAHLEGQRADLAAQLKPGDPALDQLQAKVEQTRRRLQQERQRAVAGIKSAYTAAKQKEDELRAKMEQQKTAALSLKDASVDYTILAREADTNRQLYDSVLQRLKEMEVATALRASNVSVIDQAVPPAQPSRPKKGLSLLYSAVLGLAGGVGLAFFVEYLNNTLRTSQEVERYLRLPSLGMIPDFVRSARHGAPTPEPASPEVQLLNGSAAQTAFVFTHSPFSVTTEAYRMLRTALLLAQAETSPKTLLFTSGMRGEGKTITVVNTAAVLAQMGVRVLVIDADLRCSACHTILGVENKSGLADVLSGRWDPVDVIRPTVSDHLFVLSSGCLPLNPTELVGSKQMRGLLASLQEQYDYVLIDSPPVLLASDAVLLSTMVDGVVLVANAQRTPKQVVREARLRLSYARAKVLGVVLNQLDMRQREYAYYYRKYAPAV